VRRFLALWLTLLAAFWLTSTLVSAFVFGRVDGRPESSWSLLAIPVLQAVLLFWLTRPVGAPGAILTRWRELATSRVVRALLALDLLGTLLAVGTAFYNDASRLLGQLPDFYTGGKLALTALAVGFLAIRGKGAGDSFIWLPLWGRARLLATAVGLASYSSAFFCDGLSRLLELALGELPEEYPRLILGTLLAIGLGLLVSVRPLFARRLPAAALAIDTGTALALAAGLGTFLVVLPQTQAQTAEFWSLGPRILALLSATFLLAGAWSAAVPRHPMQEEG
jgi:hypothetical protein